MLKGLEEGLHRASKQASQQKSNTYVHMHRRESVHETIMRNRPGLGAPPAWRRECAEAEVCASMLSMLLAWKQAPGRGTARPG